MDNGFFSSTSLMLVIRYSLNTRLFTNKNVEICVPYWKDNIFIRFRCRICIFIQCKKSTYSTPTHRINIYYPIHFNNYLNQYDSHRIFQKFDLLYFLFTILETRFTYRCYWAFYSCLGCSWVILKNSKRNWKGNVQFFVFICLVIF